MTSSYQQFTPLSAQSSRWLVTGAAGFIGSHLVQALLETGQQVVGLDNFSTGKRENLDQVRISVSQTQWDRFHFLQGDIAEKEICERACHGIDYVLHQAALGSVPRSLNDPTTSHSNNVTGFLNMLIAARDARVRRFVYASSSSVYGDHPALPKVEDCIGNCLSPYALTKRIDELYADVFSRCYSLSCIGLRYFNVFGPRQDPEGAYAAVIPKWIAALLTNQPVYINGDGHTSRDFCYVANVVQANVRAALISNPGAGNQVYNIAVSAATSLNDLFEMLRCRLEVVFPEIKGKSPVYRDFRGGDVRHSHADISKARRLLQYEPTHSIASGLDESLQWYVARIGAQNQAPSADRGYPEQFPPPSPSKPDDSSNINRAIRT